MPNSMLCLAKDNHVAAIKIGLLTAFPVSFQNRFGIGNSEDAATFINLDLSTVDGEPRFSVFGIVLGDYQRMKVMCRFKQARWASIIEQLGSGYKV